MDKVRHPKVLQPGVSLSLPDGQAQAAGGSLTSTRERIIEELEQIAREAMTGRRKRYAEATQALKLAAELQGFMKAPPEPSSVEDLDEETKRRIVCEEAGRYGMVWPTKEYPDAR